MKVARYIVFVAMVLGVTGSAFADLDSNRFKSDCVRLHSCTSTFPGHITLSTDQIAGLPASSRWDERGSDFILGQEGELSLPDAGLTGGAIPVSWPETSQLQVQKLPAGPGSTGLVLSGLLTIGAYQLVRSAKNVHLSHLPQWYHADGPAQIGHAVAIDLQFAPLAACIFDEPAGDQSCVREIIRRERPSRCESQNILLYGGPRGPPLFSS